MKYITTFGVLFFIAATLLAPLFPASAQQQIPLQISPTRQEVEINPGETATINVKLFNFGDSPVSGILRVADFVVTNSDGSPRLVEDATQTSPRFSGSQWVELPYDRMSIPVQDKVTIQATISVPVNARAGGRYVSIYFEPNTGSAVSGTGEREAGTSISPRIGTLVFIKVAGPITEKALISRLFAPVFLEYGPITVEADILNRGDYHIQPRGSVSLNNMWGGIVDQKKVDGTNVFPDATRTFKYELGKKWMVGRYDVNVKTSYGEGGQVIQRNIQVWVFPWKVSIALALALLIFFIMLRVMFKNFGGNQIEKQKKMEHELKKDQQEIEKLRHELENNRK